MAARRTRVIRLLLAALMSAGLITITGVVAVGPTAQAATFGANSAGTVAAPHAADAPSSTPCVVSVDADECESTDPDLTVDVSNTGDTSACTFTFSVNWGDGSPAQQATFNGAPQSGDYFLADHTYHAAQTQTYNVTATSVSVTGDCTSGDGEYAFTLDVATAVPAAPSNLTATAADQNDIKLTWQDNSNNETGFEINNGVTSTNVAANSTTYTWGGLAPGTYMCFHIRAYNSAGDSPWDPNVTPWYVCATTPKPPPPLKPTIYWSRTKGAPGTHFTLTGNGWAPGGTVQVQLPSNFYGNSSWPVDSHGDWQQNFTVGDAGPGAYTLSFSESTGHLTVTGTFKVLVAPTLTNKTWDGYEVIYGQKYTSVTANWTEPQYPLAARVAHRGLAAFWVGLGGSDGSHLQQIGTAVGYGVPFKKGKQTSPYYAWYETVPDTPNHPSLIDKPVKPGDNFSASVTYGGSSYTLELTDITQGWTFTQVIHQKYDTDSAEVVMESPPKVWPPYLSPVTFSGIKVNGASMQNPTAVIGQPNGTAHVSSFQDDSFTAYSAD